MELVPAGPHAAIDRCVGYYEPYATSHEALDREKALPEEVRNVAREVVATVRLMREGRYERPDRGRRDPRPK
jgi:hypothetical protein